MWHELFLLEEEKNQLAMSQIMILEEAIGSVMPESKSIKTAGCLTSFKIIDEEDEILMMNEELQSELERERMKNKALLKEV
jgi:hypothetical protein